ncbi:triosephosphate isomerase [Alphaproteobacteria bacterium]|nr:triosephosphate isomerase [Alphaproteobacteria bacterium]
MNLGVPESLAHLGRLSELITDTDGVEVVLCPTFLSLLAVKARQQSLDSPIKSANDKTDWILGQAQNDGRILFGAQDCFPADTGVFTGAVSAAMLAGIADYCLVGHSERRQIFHETDDDVNQKLLATIRHGIRPILCIGEGQNEPVEDVLRSQIDAGLHSVRVDVLDQITIAYEPVWAIGNGRTPTVDDIASAVSIIRSQIEYMYGRNARIRVLYGGSVDENNAEQILNIRDVDGLLVGGASLDATKFARIVEIASRVGE